MKKTNRIPFRFSDGINYFASDAYVPEIHLIIHFESKIEVPRLQKALRLLLDTEPVLGCRFVENLWKAFWEPIPENELDKAKLLERKSGSLPEQEEALNKFYGESIDGLSGPQLKAMLFSRQSGDRLVLKINHLVCDAGGFKEVLYRLSSIYTKLASDPDFRPEVRNGSRSLGQVYRNFTPFARLGIFHRGLKELFRAANPSQSQQYPAVKERQGPVYFQFKHFSRDRSAQVMDYARQHDATLNDVVVTAVFRAIARQAGWEVNKAGAMRINGTVDLRRYLPSGKADALCMLSGVYSVVMEDSVDDRFEDTLLKIRLKINEQKENYFGLGIMLVLYCMLSPYPFFIKKRAVKKQWRDNLDKGRVPPGMTNLGRIDHKKTGFGGAGVQSAYMAAPACCPPWFSCGLSEFSGTLTLSTGFYPSSIPAGQIKDFFKLVDEELPGK